MPADIRYNPMSLCKIPTECETVRVSHKSTSGCSPLQGSPPTVETELLRLTLKEKYWWKWGLSFSSHTWSLLPNCAKKKAVMLCLVFPSRSSSLTQWRHWKSKFTLSHCWWIAPSVVEKLEDVLWFVLQAALITDRLLFGVLQWHVRLWSPMHDVCCYAAELIEHDVNQESFQLSAAATDFFIFSSLEPLCLHHLESKKYTFTHDVT